MERRLPPHYGQSEFHLDTTISGDNTFEVQGDRYAASTVSSCPVIGYGSAFNTPSTGLRQIPTGVIHIDMYWLIDSGSNKIMTALARANGTPAGQRIVAGGLSNILELSGLGAGTRQALSP